MEKSLEALSPTRVFRFGVFELARTGRELRKKSRPVRLPRKSCELLVMLLESTGGIVAREEIWQQLWPESTCVQFEHALNKAVAGLRKALDDSVSGPPFFENIARRGYRFVAPVEVVDTVLPGRPRRSLWRLCER